VLALHLGLYRFEPVLAASEQLSEKLGGIGIGGNLSGDESPELGDVGSHRIEHVGHVCFERGRPILDGDDPRRQSRGRACSS